MPPTQRDVVKPPNEGEFKTTDGKAMNGFLPLTRGASPEKPPNMSRLMHGDPGGSADMTRLGSPVKTPNDGIFRDGDRGYVDQRAAAIEPGKPVVPVNPFVDDAGLLGKPPTPVLKSR